MSDATTKPTEDAKALGKAILRAMTLAHVQRVVLDVSNSRPACRISGADDPQFLWSSISSTMTEAIEEATATFAKMFPPTPEPIPDAAIVTAAEHAAEVNSGGDRDHGRFSFATFAGLLDRRTHPRLRPEQDYLALLRANSQIVELSDGAWFLLPGGQERADQ